MFYILQKEKNFSPSLSYETNELLNYFTIKDEDENENDDKDNDKIISNIDLNKQITFINLMNIIKLI